MEGTVKFFNEEKRFGFIEAGGRDIFVHESALVHNINKGDRVKFEIGENKKGECAVNVQKINT